MGPQRCTLSAIDELLRLATIRSYTVVTLSLLGPISSYISLIARNLFFICNSIYRRTYKFSAIFLGTFGDHGHVDHIRTEIRSVNFGSYMQIPSSPRCQPGQSISIKRAIIVVWPARVPRGQHMYIVSNQVDDGSHSTVSMID